MAVNALRDLQQTAIAVLDVLLPSSAGPAQIIEVARRARDPTSTRSIQLKGLLSKLQDEIEHFTNQTYVDIHLVRQIFPPGLNFGGKRWAPDPILHQVNCARLAAEVLLATGSSASKQAIAGLEGVFPSPFMNGFVGGGRKDPCGESSLEKATFDLALDIRTQFFRLELEERQHEPNFSPEKILQTVFCDDSLDGNDHLEDAGGLAFRGFGLHVFQDENGRLPKQFEEAVQDRVDDLSIAWRNEEDDSVNIAGVKAAHPWQGFVSRTIRWVKRRCDEIDKEAQLQPGMNHVLDALKTFDRPQVLRSKLLDTVAHDPLEIAESELRETLELDTDAGAVVSPRKDAQKDVERSFQRSRENRSDAVVNTAQPAEIPTIERTPRRKSGRKSVTSPFFCIITICWLGN